MRNKATSGAFPEQNALPGSRSQAFGAEAGKPGLQPPLQQPRTIDRVIFTVSSGLDRAAIYYCSFYAIIPIEKGVL